MPADLQTFLSDVAERLECEQDLALSDSRKASSVGWVAVLGSIASGVLALAQAPRFLTAGFAVVPALVTALQREFRWAEWRDWHWDYVDRLDALLTIAKYKNVSVPDLGARLETIIKAKTESVGAVPKRTTSPRTGKDQNNARDPGGV